MNQPRQTAASFTAADRLREANLLERAGRMGEARSAYAAAAGAAEREGAAAVLAEALRAQAVIHCRRGESDQARPLLERSHAIATELNDPTLAARALNTWAVLALEAGELNDARDRFARALELSEGDAPTIARIEQNLGILDNIQGRLPEALHHYQRSLDAYILARDEGGQALAYHNLGMISADQSNWEEADHQFGCSLAIAKRTGDTHLQGLCHLNHTEVLIARQRYDEARQSAEGALHIFNQLDAELDKADVYRVLGVVFREIGRPAIAEARFNAAIDLAVRANSMLSEAEARRELAILYQLSGRNQEALSLLNTAHNLFGQLDARRDLVDVGGKVAALEGTYLKVVREWGQSIESADSYTHGHCSRVAGFAVALARALGLDEAGITAIRLGAYLHDVGKVRVPHEILNKPGKLTPQEFAVIQMHPIWGLELLDGIEFPWDLRPIIRWHHEKLDGSGYPDGLAGDAIPLSAQIIGIVDVYDALTTTRSYRAAMDATRALEVLAECRQWWRDDVYETFMRAVGIPAAKAAA